jgi:pyrimidine-specific ribonucleoside hydrolase
MWHINLGARLSRVKVLIDTDFAGDTDDACAVALVLGTADVELIAATTVADPDGMRAGYLDYFLRLAGRDLPTAAGAGTSLTTGKRTGGLPDHAKYWGNVEVTPPPGPEAAAVELLEASVDASATIVAIGPYTNLALLAAARPGLLEGARVVLMGGWITPTRPGLPPWGPNRDWNVQCDTTAAETTFGAAGKLTLVTLPASLDATLRQRDIDRLYASGPIGQLLARQAKAHSDERDMRQFGRAHPGLPDDLLNFQYDVVACAVAVGMPLAVLEDLVLAPRRDDGLLRFEARQGGRTVTTTTNVNGDTLNGIWLASINRADAGAWPQE